MLLTRKTVIPLFVLLTFVIAFGTAGYSLIEGWPVVDSLYMTAITLTTVGFGEVQPLSNLGRVFTIILIFMGVSTVAYGFSTISEHVLASDLGPRIRRRRNRRMLAQLNGHVLVCGYGRVGSSAVATLSENNATVVIIEKEEKEATTLQEMGFIVVLGDATKDETLKQAGIERANGLVVCTGNDSDNLFIVLSSRTLNPDLYIVARAADYDNESKMRRAGANRVVSPYRLGGRHMANVLTRPHVTEFLDVVNLDSGLELWLEELAIEAESPLAGRTVIESDLRRNTGVTLVALMRRSTGAAVTPNHETRLEVGDQLIVLGTREQLKRLESLANP